MGRVGVASLALAVSLWGCAGAPHKPSGGSEGAALEQRQALALARARGQVVEATGRADQEQALAPNRGPRWFVARYNRAPCDCPAYELLVRGAWVRHYPSEPGRIPRGAGLFLVRGSIRNARIKALNNNEYNVLEISQLMPGQARSLEEAWQMMRQAAAR
jgi:hypothetical protein